MVVPSPSNDDMVFYEHHTVLPLSNVKVNLKPLVQATGYQSLCDLNKVLAVDQVQ